MADNFYFEPPSRIQLVEKMSHLARFSNFMLLVMGPEKSGKTTVLDQLNAAICEADTHHVELVLEEQFGQTLLLREITNQLVSFLKEEEASPAADPFSDLQQKIETLAKLGHRMLISVDNADHLSNEALAALAGLLAAHEDKVELVLAGSELLLERVTAEGITELLDGRVHPEVLAPFSREEAEEFLQLRFVRGNDLTKKQYAQLYKDSEGYPGRLTDSAAELIRSGQIKLAAGGRMLPMPHLVGIALILLGIGGVSAWQFISGDQALEEQAEAETDLASVSEVSEQATDERVSVPLALNLAAGEEAVESPASDARELLAARLAEQEQSQQQQAQPVEQLAAEQVEGIEAAPSVAAVALVPNLAVASAVAVSSNLEDQETVPVQNAESLNNSSTDEAVNRQPENPQVSVATTEKTTDFAPAASFQKANDEQPTASVNKASDSSATAVQKTPVKPAQPTVKAPEKVVKAEPKPQVKAAPKKPAATAKSNPASRWLKEQQLSAWPSSGYTLQVLGAREPSSIVAFMRAVGDTSRLYYFRTQLKGKPWHVVVYGQYSNRKSAVAAIKSLPSYLQQQKPWPRSIKGVKTDMQKK